MNQFYLFCSVFFCKTEVYMNIAIPNTKNRKLKTVLRYLIDHLYISFVQNAYKNECI